MAKQARALTGQQNPIQMLHSMLNGKTIEKAWPIIGPAQTFKGMTIIFEDGTIITVESWLLESKIPHKDPEKKPQVVTRPVLRVERKK